MAKNNRSAQRRRNQNNPYWTKEKVSKAASKCSSRTEFQKAYNGAYDRACTQGWLEEVCSHMVPSRKPSGYWTEQTCKEALLECQTRTEFCKKYPQARKVLNDLGILDECYSQHTFRPKKSRGISEGIQKRLGVSEGNWTKAKVRQAALNFLSKGEFSKEAKHAFKLACENGWLEELCSHMDSKIKPNGFWTFETSREAALDCKTRNEFRQKYQRAAVVLSELGVLHECCSHMEIQANIMKRLIYVFEFPKSNTAYVGLTWNSEERFETHTRKGKAGKSPVYKYINSVDSEFTYKKLTKKVDVKNAVMLEKYFIDKYLEDGWKLLNKHLGGGSLGSLGKTWTRDKVIKEAKKYKTQKEFRIRGKGAPAVAKELKIPDEELFGHMRNLGYQNKRSGYWTEERILEVAKKYSRRIDWKTNDSSSYTAASTKKILDKATAHMNPRNSQYTTELGAIAARLIEEGKTFKAVGLALGVNRETIRVGWCKYDSNLDKAVTARRLLLANNNNEN